MGIITRSLILHVLYLNFSLYFFLLTKLINMETYSNTPIIIALTVRIYIDIAQVIFFSLFNFLFWYLPKLNFLTLVKFLLYFMQSV